MLSGVGRGGCIPHTSHKLTFYYNVLYSILFLHRDFSKNTPSCDETCNNTLIPGKNCESTENDPVETNWFTCDMHEL